MRSITLLLLLGLLSAPLAAQTNVSGTLAADTRWTLAGSPYVVTGTVTIAGTDGADAVTTLTIEPGVEVRFRTNTRLQVGTNSAVGALVADGLNGPGSPARILFTSDAAAPARGDWQRIAFEGDAPGDLSLIRHATVEFAGRGNSSAGITVSHQTGTVVLDDVIVRESAEFGIRLQTGPAELRNCRIDTTDLVSIRVDNAASVSALVDGCTLESIDYVGVNGLVDWENVTLENWGQTRSVFTADAFGDFYTAATFASVVAEPIIDIEGSNIVRDATWGPRGGRLRIVNSKTVRGTDGPDGVTTLTIEPGTVVAMETADALNIATGSVPGRLIADGSAGPGAPAEILFTSAQETPQPGDWRRIIFAADAAPDSLIRLARIEYAGSTNFDGAIQVEQNLGAVTLEQLTITDNAQFGVRIADGFVLRDSTLLGNGITDLRFGSAATASGIVEDCVLGSLRYTGNSASVDWIGNQFVDWGVQPSEVAPNDVLKLLDPSNSFTSPLATPQFTVRAGTINVDSTWNARAGRIVAAGSLTILGSDGADATTTLVLEPGTTLAFQPGGALIVDSGTSTSGELIADASDAAPIVLTSAQPVPAPGDWAGLSLRTGSGVHTRLSNVLLEYGGSGGRMIDHRDDDKTVPLHGITIRQSAGDGVRFLGDGGIDLQDCLIESVVGHSIVYTGGGNSGTITNCAFESIEYTGSNQVGELDFSGNIVTNWGAVRSVLASNHVSDFIAGASVEKLPDAEVDVLAQPLTRDARWTNELGVLNFFGFAPSIRGADGPDGITTLRVGPGTEITVESLGDTFWIVGGTGGSIDFGRLILDGRLPQGGRDPVLLRSANGAAAGFDWGGISMLDQGWVQIYEAEIRDVTFAVQAGGSSTIEALEGLTVRNADRGIRLGASADVVTGRFDRLDLDVADYGLDISTFGLIVADSNIVAGAIGVRNNDEVTFCVDATGNYWGDPSGPSGSPPLTGCETDTPPGSGSSISEGVLFDSARTAPYVPVPNNPYLLFSDSERAFWDPVAGAVSYGPYRQVLSTVGATPFAVCRNDLDGDTGDTEWVDLETPLPGEAFAYLVTAFDALGQQGTLGRPTTGSRQSVASCP